MAASRQPGHESLKQKAFEEMKKYAALTAYLWVLFFLLGMYRRLLLKENGIDPWTQSYAIVNALVFAKVMLLGEIIDLGAWLRKRVFVWVVLGRTALFTALLMAFHVVEEAVRALIKGEAVASSMLHLGGGSWTGVLVYAGLLFVMLLPLITFREISFVLGKGVLWGIMTRRETKS
ncbi:hypothetical protein DK847_18425 [Aestuariivirga litoralis]|uniref:Uncharacterized protein n=1 Tax=Aestuariivirga litoralis TaxID=2650924 RepID=A0A2W2ASJ9_9HYPH|nr:hypothetical protein [Aestuariivirga litoralis]PZF75490.1 hypothetical protein DK847_18425 [Aestuariivirga litoralis]